jgi:L-alanine-DL-glutamate epimerase-like enolase superfamily enzyme/ribosomal protein S18 acetylase RimI-like enzyme
VTVTLRSATGSDLPALTSVFIAAWRGGYGDVVPAAVLESLDAATVAGWLGPLVTDETTATVVAVADGGVAGFVRYGPDPERPGGGHVAALYVDPRSGGRGVGRALLDSALTALHRAGRPEVGLWVFEANVRARRLYERAGFRPDGRRTVDPRWRAPQIGYLRRARNLAVPLPPLPEVDLAPVGGFLVSRVHRPLRRPFRTALRERRELAGWRLTVTTADGLTAVGTTVATPEVTGDTDETIATALAGPLRAAVAGGGPSGRVLEAVAAAGAGCPSAAAAVDIAVHGLVAAALGQTVGEVLGGAVDGPAPTVITVAVDSPDAMADAAAELAAEGALGVKIKLADAALDVARVLAVRDRLAGTPVSMRIDANQAWTAEESVRVLEALHRQDVPLELVEQPVAAHDLPGLAFVRARSPYPLLADESVFTADDVRRVADAGAADMVNLKLLKSGGLHPARDVVAAAAEAALGLLVGCMLEPEEGVAAAGALASLASDGPLAHDLDAPWWVSGPDATGR